MSPSEPSLTAKKCGSPMRGLAHRFQEFPRGVIFRVANNRHANAQPLSRRTFRHRFRCVVRALGVDVGPEGSDQRLPVWLANQTAVTQRTPPAHTTDTPHIAHDWPP